MTGMVLTKGNIDPTIIVGGRVTDFGGGAKIGRSHFLVLEADEYDRDVSQADSGDRGGDQYRP